MAGSKWFSVMYFNCRSVLPKLDELAALCSANNPDIVLLKLGFVMMSQTVRYAFLITPLLDVIGIDVVEELLFSFITVSGITHL